MEMLSELHMVFDALQHPLSLHKPSPLGHPRVIILKAAGKAFSGGVDIKAADRGIGGKAWDYKDMRSQQLLSRLIQKMRQVPQPIICAVQGMAAGAGLALALASDIRVATPMASFSAAFVRLGLTGTDMGTSFFLPRIAGLGLSAEALLTGRSIPAQRAYEVGLVNKLVNDTSELHIEAKKYAAEMLQCSELGLQLTKEQLNSVADGGSLSAAMVGENSHQMLLVNDPKTSSVAQTWLNTMLSKSSRSKM